MNAKPAPAAKAGSQSIDTNGALPIAAGGALALLTLGGIGAALIGRRRRRRYQEEADAETMAYEPFETAAVAEPTAGHRHEPVAAVHREEPAAAERSAFAWGDTSQANTPGHTSQSTTEDDDRRPGETWVERAYRGPSPSNPSVSLKNRLKRAAFFDKREREAAAGIAEPVDATAGLPEAAVEEQERELA